MGSGHWRRPVKAQSAARWGRRQLLKLRCASVPSQEPAAAAEGVQPLAGRCPGAPPGPCAPWGPQVLDLEIRVNPSAFRRMSAPCESSSRVPCSE